MTSEAFILACLADLAAAFPRQEIAQRTLRVYVLNLVDIPEAALAEACRSLMCSALFFPAIREIREAAVERLLMLPTETEALGEVDARIAWAWERREDEEPPEVHPLVRGIVDRLGGFASFRTSERPGAVRREFCRLYRDVRQQEIFRAQTGKIALPSGPAVSIMLPEGSS